MGTDLLLQLHFSLLMFLILLFGQSLMHKLQDLLRFSGYIANYHPVLGRYSYRMAQGLVVAESIVLVLSLIPSFSIIGQVGMFLLLLTYHSVIGYALITGKTSFECGCGDTPLLVSGRILLRNTLLTLCAVLMLLLPIKGSPTLSLEAALCGGGLIWLCYQLCEQLLRNSDLQQQLTGKSSS